MKKILSGLSKFFATIFAILFILATALTLLLYNTGRQLFSARLYKNAFLEQNLYARLPGLAGAAVVASVSYDPCAENPLTCENISPELRACYEQSLGSERYLVLASGQETPNETEKPAVQACLDANPPPPGEGEGGMPPFLKNLSASDWEITLKILLPPDELRAMTEPVIDQFFAYLDGKTESVSVSLVPLKERLAGPSGIEAIHQILLAQPPCTPDELAQMKGESKTADDKMVMCNPGEAEFTSVLPRLQEQLNSAAARIPNKTMLIKAAAPSASAGPLGERDSVVAGLRLIRLILRASPLVPLACLLLVTLFGVRSLKGWLRWWGIPLFAAALIALGLGLSVLPLLEKAWSNFLAPRFPPVLPAEFALLAHSLLAYVAHAISEKIILHSIILLVFGLGAWVGSYFVKEEETPAVPPPAPVSGEASPSA